jgi:phosphatidylglycerophosphate synthase
MKKFSRFALPLASAPILYPKLRKPSLVAMPMMAAPYLGYVLSFCYGEIACYRNMRTEFGHCLDVATDRLKDVSLFTAVTLLAVRESRSTTVVFAGLLALGGTMVYAYSVSAR